MTTPLKDSDLARHLNPPQSGKTEGGKAVEQGIAKNKEFAAEILSLVSSLRGNKGFDWFMSECVGKLLKTADRELKDPQTADDRLKYARDTFHLLQAIYNWPDEMEANARQTLNPDDPRARELMSKINN